MSGCLTGNINEEQLAKPSSGLARTCDSMLQDSIDQLTRQSDILLLLVSLILLGVMIELAILASFL
jgi:hypothetical protein